MIVPSLSPARTSDWRWDPFEGASEEPARSSARRPRWGERRHRRAGQTEHSSALSAGQRWPQPRYLAVPTAYSYQNPSSATGPPRFCPPTPSYSAAWSSRLTGGAVCAQRDHTGAPTAPAALLDSMTHSQHTLFVDPPFFSCRYRRCTALCVDLRLCRGAGRPQPTTRRSGPAAVDGEFRWHLARLRRRKMRPSQHGRRQLQPQPQRTAAATTTAAYPTSFLQAALACGDGNGNALPDGTPCGGGGMPEGPTNVLMPEGGPAADRAAGSHRGSSGGRRQTVWRQRRRRRRRRRVAAALPALPAGTPRRDRRDADADADADTHARAHADADAHAPDAVCSLPSGAPPGAPCAATPLPAAATVAALPTTAVAPAPPDAPPPLPPRRPSSPPPPAYADPHSYLTISHVPHRRRRRHPVRGRLHHHLLHLLACHRHRRGPRRRRRRLHRPSRHLPSHRRRHHHRAAAEIAA